MGQNDATGSTLKKKFKSFGWLFLRQTVYQIIILIYRLVSTSTYAFKHQHSITLSQMRIVHKHTGGAVVFLQSSEI